MSTRVWQVPARHASSTAGGCVGHPAGRGVIGTHACGPQPVVRPGGRAKAARSWPLIGHPTVMLSPMTTAKELHHKCCHSSFFILGTLLPDTH